jgi:peptidoglycan/xylan/chitin deacetylase (PgdA/CDA1 family)
MASNYTQILRNLFFDIAYQTGISSPFRSMLVKNKNIIVLICHRVSDISDDIDQMRPPMPVASFRSLMEQLAKTFRIIDINDIKKLPDHSGPPFMVLTFDDGYKDFIENAVPILLDLGIPATQSICPLLVDKETPPWTQVLEVCLYSLWGSDLHNNLSSGAGPSLQNTYLKLPDGSNFKISKSIDQKTFVELCDQLYFEDDETREIWLDDLVKKLTVTFDHFSLMTWNDIRDCIQHGFSIASHGYSHRNLARVKEPKLLETEISFSRQRILEETGVAPSVFSFPNGLYNDSLLKIVKESGYEIALVCDEKPANIDIINDSDGVVCLPRIEIHRGNWKEEVLRSCGFHYQMKYRWSGSDRERAWHPLRG